MLRHRPIYAGTPPKILCVDDDPYLTDLLLLCLERDGYAVSVAGDGATALRLVQSEPPDVVLLDLHLPDTNGLTLSVQLRRLGHMPIIMLTASHSDAEMVAGFQHGAGRLCGPNP